jgi:mannobiose 2-epimerase
MIYEFDPETGHSNSSRDWWVMAEAMVGFYNAYQMSNKVHYLEKSENSWEFIKEYLIDHENGEWYGGVTPDHKITSQTKGSPWKAPYHNLRACMEIYKRIA